MEVFPDCRLVWTWKESRSIVSTWTVSVVGNDRFLAPSRNLVPSTCVAGWFLIEVCLLRYFYLWTKNIQSGFGVFAAVTPWDSTISFGIGIAAFAVAFVAASLLLPRLSEVPIDSCYYWLYFVFSLSIVILNNTRTFDSSWHPLNFIVADLAPP